jgi:vacuolar-type H+-ATPase subunit E/Vma4
MAREDLHFRLRLPQEIKDRIEESAEANRRSITAEIIARLVQSLESDMTLSDHEKRLETLERWVTDLRARTGEDVYNDND